MSNGYNEFKVFYIHEEGWPTYIEAFTCRGVACDTLRSWGRSFRMGARVEEGRILSLGPDQPVQDDRIYRCLDLDTQKTTSWYYTETEAKSAAKACRLKPAETFNGKDYYTVQFATINTKEIDPLPPKFPVRFQKDEKGRLYTRFDAHPELTGISQNGKVFFPDRSFKNADIGDAIVSVSMEKDKFGFVTGEMVKFDCPHFREVLDWAWEKNLSPDSELVIINHPARGRYYAIYDGTGYERILYYRNDEGKPYVGGEYVYCPIVEEDVARYTERRETLTQFFFEDVWGMGIDLDAIADQFKESEFFLATYGCLHWDKSLKIYSDIIERAVDKGILEQFRVPELNIDVVSVNCDNMFCMLAYTLDEVKALAAEVTKINAEADETAKRLRRKGKLIW